MRYVRLHIKGSVRRLFVGCGLYEHEQDGTVIRSHLEGSRTAFERLSETAQDCGARSAENRRSNRPWCADKLLSAYHIQYAYLVYLLYLFYLYYDFEKREIEERL